MRRRVRRPARRASIPRPLAAGLLLATLALAALAAPLIEAWLGLDATTVDLLARLEPPSAAHPLGTDELGRDVLARLLQAGRVSLAVGLCGALLAAAIGTVVGLAAGYAGGALDALLMRLTDMVISLPLLPLLIVLAAIDLGKLGLPGPRRARQRGPHRRDRGPVRLDDDRPPRPRQRARACARASSCARRGRSARGRCTILRRHILPNALAPLIVATTLSIGNVILVESVLSFLGLGVQPPVPSWGNMLTGAQELLFEAPRLALWPGLLIFLSVLAFNVLGDGLQAALDPRRRQR